MFPHWLAWVMGMPMLALLAIRAFKAGRRDAAEFKRRNSG